MSIIRHTNRIINRKQRCLCSPPAPKDSKPLKTQGFLGEHVANALFAPRQTFSFHAQDMGARGFAERKILWYNAPHKTY